MNYRVVVQPNAKSDLRNYFLTAAEHAPRTAARWLERFEAALASLCTAYSTRDHENRYAQ